MTAPLTIPALLYLVTGLFVFSVLVNAVRKLRVYKLADYLLVIYLGVLFLINLALFGGELDWWRQFSPEIQSHLPWFGVLLLSGVFYALTRAVFGKEPPGWGWLAASLGILTAVVLVDSRAFFKEEIFLRISWGVYTRSIITMVILALGWGVFLIFTALYLLQAYRKAERNVVRQRSIYWTAALVIFTGSSILYLNDQPLLGTFLLVFNTLIINYLVLTYRLPDLRMVLLQTSCYTLTGLLMVLLYAVGFLLLERVFNRYVWYQPVYNGAFLFVFSLAVFSPVNHRVKSTLEKIIIQERDRTKEIRNYSKTLSSILDIELLSKVTMEMICDALDVKKGSLFLVDPLESEGGPPHWRLRAVPCTTTTLPDLDFLPAGTPITRVLSEEKRPLTQSELEFIPKFQTIPENILTWIRDLEVEAFIPIHTEDEWIGLFALSPKRSGASFTDEEIEFLSTLADQTSVALQNARLVESLTNIDNQLRRAKASKNTALDKIEHIKRSASDIISIKAHELRSSLTVISGYTQLLANNVELMEDDYYAELINGMLSGLDQLQQTIDSMISSANVKPGNLEIDTRPTSLYSLIDGICRDLAEKVQARKITLSHDSLGEIPPVYGDLDALRKSFRTLIVYAMTHTPSGGKIRITGRYIPPRSDVLKWEGAEIIVCDTGIGIDEEAQDRFFQEQMPSDLEQYLAEDSSLEDGKPADQLAVVRGIIEAHNGRVWVERTEKDTDHLPGSEFHVVLPLEQRTHPTQKVKTQPPFRETKTG